MVCVCVRVLCVCFIFNVVRVLAVWLFSCYVCVLFVRVYKICVVRWLLLFSYSDKQNFISVIICVYCV